MRVVLSWVTFVGWALAVLAALVPSCSTSPSAGVPYTGAAPDFTEVCHASSCTCPDGRRGQSQCIDGGGVGPCSCEGCPPFTRYAPPDFAPCGGEPFGTWRLRKLNTNGVSLSLSTQSIDGTTSSGQCPADVPKPMSIPDLRIDLQDGGDMDIHSAGISLTLRITESCLSEKVGVRCDRLDLGFGKCSSEDCGICNCSTGSTAGDEHGTWSRTPTALTLQVDSFRAVGTDFSYCVHDDTMDLGDLSGAVFTYERVQGSGTPAACGVRSPTDCAIGKGCHVGACVGGTDCTSAQAESSCTNRQGCTWDTNQCSGVAPATCTLADYDIVPGCKFVGILAKCTGTPTPCGPKVQADCAASPGCKAGPGCAGDGPLNCSKYNDLCSSCTMTAGCACSAITGDCTGAPTCAQQTDQNVCRSWSQCTWSPFVCKGESTPCEMISVAQCTAATGCQIQGAM